MIDLPSRVERAILEGGLLTVGDSMVVAVSGGLDSMVLLNTLATLRGRHGWSLSVAHFNHQLRGSGSNADEALVRQTASALKLPFHAGRGGVRTFARQHKLSIEMAARQLRHEFLAATALKRAIGKVVLAHHADDQLELFFLRLLRGAGPEGLAGMRSIAPSPAHPTVQLIRPLLNFSRAELESFAAERRIQFRHDPSNAELNYERNRIRHELLPLLRSKFQPALDHTIGRLIETLACESDFVADRARALMSEGGTAFDDLHPAIQRRWLRTECHQLGMAPDFDLIERLRSDSGVESMIDPERLVFRDSSGRVHFRTPVPASIPVEEKRIRIKGGSGSAEFGGVKLSWRVKSRNSGPLPVSLGHPVPNKSSGREQFDAAKVGSLVRLRRWRPGDRFQPIGMPTAAKLQNLFVNQKIPRAARHHLLIAENAAGAIFWVEGLRISERAKLDSSTTRILEWSWERTAT